MLGVGTLLCVAAALCAPGAAAAQGSEASGRVEVARKLKESTVTLKAANHTGSGFVVSREGWIITNLHVVKPARFTGRVEVQFGDGTKRRGKVLLTDEDCDLALVQVRGEVKVSPLTLGDSDKLQVGESVMAFGSPYGLEATLTSGVVSAKRDMPRRGKKKLEGVIQTDAPINAGSSGGPLVTTRGDVVGVNTAIYSRSGGNEGIGFALPTKYVRALVARARGESPPGQARGDDDDATRQPLRVSLGARVEDYDRLGYAGVRIVAVQKGGACARAGLRGVEDEPPQSVKHKGMPWTGHIITAVDGKSIHDTGELRAALAKLAPGDEVKLSVTVGPGRTKQKITLRFPK